MSVAFRWEEVMVNYKHDSWILAYGSARIKPEQVIDILLAEYAIRELRQREQVLSNRVIALQKTEVIESEGSELEKAKEKLEEIRAKVPGKEYALYRAVSMLDSYFKAMYDRLRCDTKWFMRKEMVRDCVDRGGCCSRGCGCCSQRPLHNGGKGDGHCTTECWCCTVYRGYEVPKDDKEEIRADLKKRLEHDRSAYLIYMTSCFFCLLPKPPAEAPKDKAPASTPPKPKSWWQRVFGCSK